MPLIFDTDTTDKTQPSPTGNGRIVLFRAIFDQELDSWMEDILLERALAGRKKYGTWLRANNGRSALQDALEEALDGYMYATQLRMEADSHDAEELQRMFLGAAQLCKAIEARNPTLTQTFDKMRAEFGNQIGEPEERQ